VPYSEILPSAALEPWVECFWTRTSDAPSGPHRILPDGCADLVFDLTRGEADAVGTMTKPLVLEAEEQSAAAFGVRFRPGRAAAFLRIPLAELTDARVRLDELWRDVPEQITVETLEQALLRRLAPSVDRRVGASVDRRVDAAVARIIRTNARIDDIARDVGISRQHLARQFQQHVGVSPKTFARVMRFRRLVESLPAGDVDWADLAAGHGYYDQSHLIDEFRELAGTTPAHYLASRGR
jgi:AraC-like DNA-binding protein